MDPASDGVAHAIIVFVEFRWPSEWIRLGLFARLRQIAPAAYDRMVSLVLDQSAVDGCITEALTDEDRRGLTALFWPNINPYGTLRLEMDKRLDLGPTAAVPRPRSGGTAVGDPKLNAPPARS